MSPVVYAQDWVFGESIVIKASQARIFHHLESSGRRNIALSGDVIGITWEDDRGGMPSVYLARKAPLAKSFSSEIRISGAGEAYEPSIAGLNNEQFVIAWEESGKVFLRLVDKQLLGDPIGLGHEESGQVNVTTKGNSITAVFSEREGQFRRIVLVELLLGSQGLLENRRCVVDSHPIKDEQLYPVVVNTHSEQVVAWEDRRRGHTIIMASTRRFTDGCQFSKPERISEGPDISPNQYGAGHGVARVSLAPYGDSAVYAAWADKRDFREGYDIYGANRRPAGPFGGNTKIQDDFGEVARQWHVALASNNEGLLVASWDDEREGNTDIMMSWWDGNDWSDDSPVQGASGPGEQTHSTMVMDESGNLHIAWVERDAVGGETRLKYAFGTLAKTNQ